MNGHPFDSRHTWPERHNWLITQTSRVDSKSRQSELHSLPVRKKNIHDIICDIQEFIIEFCYTMSIFKTQYIERILNKLQGYL